MSNLTSEDVRDAFRYLFEAELPALKELVKMLPSNPLVINIGSGSGTSGLAILESRPDVVLITIDITDLSSPFGCLEAERDVVKRAGLSHKAGSSWRQILGDSIDIGLMWSDIITQHEVRSDLPPDQHGRFYRHADMVFVDGDHSYEHAKEDIEIWLTNLRDGGIIAVHDYLKADIPPQDNGPHPKNWPGVDRAVAETLVGKHDLILHVDSLIAFKKVVP